MDYSGYIIMDYYGLLYIMGYSGYIPVINVGWDYYNYCWTIK